MTTIKLLNSYPLATEVVKEWFWKEMIKSFENDAVPEDFKQMMLADGIGNENLAQLIDAQPRVLFDVFDENKIYIHIEPWDNEMETGVDNFGFRIALQEYNPKNMDFKTRKEAEIKAIEEAFKILEVKITPTDVKEIIVITEDND